MADKQKLLFHFLSTQRYKEQNYQHCSIGTFFLLFLGVFAVFQLKQSSPSSLSSFSSSPSSFKSGGYFLVKATGDVPLDGVAFSRSSGHFPANNTSQPAKPVKYVLLRCG